MAGTDSSPPSIEGTESRRQIDLSGHRVILNPSTPTQVAAIAREESHATRKPPPARDFERRTHSSRQISGRTLFLLGHGARRPSGRRSHASRGYRARQRRRMHYGQRRAGGAWPESGAPSGI